MQREKRGKFRGSKKVKTMIFDLWLSPHFPSFVAFARSGSLIVIMAIVIISAFVGGSPMVLGGIAAPSRKR